MRADDVFPDEPDEGRASRAAGRSLEDPRAAYEDLPAERPRPAGDAPTREQIEQQFVELVTVGTPSEAQRMARRLREKGVLALANVEDCGRGLFRAFVVVHEAELDRARHAFDELIGVQGDACNEVIRAEMLAAQESPEQAWYDEAQRELRAKMWRVGLVVLVVAGGIAALILLKNR